MKTLSLLIKPASSLCNLRCRYCFYADVSSLRQTSSFGVMTEDIARQMTEHVFEDLDSGDEVTFAFQGGEPMLAGLSWFERFVKDVSEVMNAQNKSVTVRYALQTNGIALNEDWCAFLAKNRFLVGLSLDGEGAFHDENRVDEQGCGTFRKVMAAKRLLEHYEVSYNILLVLTNHCARYPRRVWHFLQEQDIRYVQIIPCLSPLEADRPTPQALTPQRFSSFYIQLFALWSADLARGVYRSVKFFDDLFHLLKEKSITACGFTGICQLQYVVEADGSVYPCDFYVLDEWRGGSLTTQRPSQIAKTPPMENFLLRPRTRAVLCEGCAWQSFCGGGCPRMAQSMYLDETQQFCGYRAFLDACAPEIKRVAQRYLR